MDCHLVIATMGRARVLTALVPFLAAQDHAFASVTLVGTHEADVATARREAEAALECPVRTLISDRPGLCRQRNAALSALKAAGAEGIIAFWDDDFRPARDWARRAIAVFEESDDVVGLTGRLLADGVRRGGLSEAEAEAILSGHAPPSAAWASGPCPRDVTSAYGCNMAFRLSAALRCRFDERLPLYGWQEDRDFTGQVLSYGRVIYAPEPRGVHLGTSGGRTSGTRMGYSQVANPLYLQRKGTMEAAFVRRFLWRALAANVVRSVLPKPGIDHRGRLRGNLLAWRDVARGRCEPERVLEIG